MREIVNLQYCHSIVVCVCSIPRGKVAHAHLILCSTIGLKFHPGRGDNVTHDRQQDSSLQLTSFAAFLFVVRLVRFNAFWRFISRHLCDNMIQLLFHNFVEINKHNRLLRYSWGHILTSFEWTQANYVHAFVFPIHSELELGLSKNKHVS